MKLFVTFITFFAIHLFSSETCVLKGFLGRLKISSAEKLLDSALLDGNECIFVIDSSTGSFEDVLLFCQKFAHFKHELDVKVSVYIEGKALGPAALIPFLADEIFLSKDAIWGDFFLGADFVDEKQHILSQIKTFISRNHQKLHSLEMLVEAMGDSTYQIVGTVEGSPMTINSQQAQSLGVVDLVLTKDDFTNLYPNSSVQTEKVVLDNQVLSIKSPNYFSQELKNELKNTEEGEVKFGYVALTLDNPITTGTVIYFQKAFEEFIKQKVSAVILDMNTPGGEVFAAMKISELLQKLDVQYGIPTICYIDNWAVSAGALLALSCRFIVSNQLSLMGAAEPVIQTSDGQESASEKINSALRTEFMNVASLYGRSSLLAEAMVDKDVIVVLRKHKLVKLSSESEIRKEGADPDELIALPGKLLTLRSDQLYDLGMSDYVLQGSSTSDEEKERFMKGITPASEHPLFTIPVLASFSGAQLLGYSNWKVSLLSLLTHPIISSLLFFAVIIGLYIELQTPGFGVFGVLAIVSLALLGLGSFSLESYSFIELGFILLGILLLILELFVIPGFGVTGLLGFGFLLIGLVLLSLPFVDSVDFTSMANIGAYFSSMTDRIIGFFIASVAALITVALLSRYILPRFSPLILEDDQSREKGFSAHDTTFFPEEGSLGVTVTPLRPGGKVQIGGNYFDALSEEGYVESGQAIVVVSVQTGSVVVRRAEKR